MLTVNSGTICVGQSFTINPTGINTFIIQGGNAIVSPSINTTYTVVGTNTVTGCSSNVTSSLVVNPNPTITVNSGVICAGQTFTINPNGANTYTIQGGNAVVSPSSNSSYTVIGTNTVTGCRSQTFATSNLTVNALPALTSTPSILLSACQGSTGAITGIVIPGANTYTWTSGANIIGNSVNLNNQPAGSYLLIASNSNGCVNSFGPYSIINPNAPSAPTASASANSLCVGQAISLFASSSPSTTFNWTGPNFNSSTQNPIIPISTTTMSGVYSVYATILGCSGPATNLTLTVNPNPTITVNSGVICSGESFTINPTGANTYTIQGGNAVVSPTATSSYTVSGTSSSGCKSQSFATSNLSVNICLGIEKNNENLLNILIYPNPTSDNTNLIIDTYNLESLNVNVYDVTGKLVMSPIQNQSLLIGENKFTINTKDLNNGMYFVILTTNKGNETVKLIINK